MCYLCKNHTHIDLQYEKRLCQRLRQGLVRLLHSAFVCSWSCSARSSLGSDAAQTPNLNVLNTLSTLDCSLSCNKCLVFFPVWVQLKLQDICQTGWDSFTTLGIPLQCCEEWSIKSPSLTYKQCILAVLPGLFEAVEHPDSCRELSCSLCQPALPFTKKSWGSLNEFISELNLAYDNK